jgi:hypothetical protein
MLGNGRESGSSHSGYHGRILKQEKEQEMIRRDPLFFTLRPYALLGFLTGKT